MNTTAVYLNEEEATLFVEFQKRYAFIKALEELKVFDIKNGSVEIHFNDISQVVKIDTHQHYRPI